MVELEDLPSVGEKTAEKLRDAGFADMMRLATATPKELSVKAEIGEGVAEKVIEAARKAEDIGFETALEVADARVEFQHLLSEYAGELEQLTTYTVQFYAVSNELEYKSKKLEFRTAYDPAVNFWIEDIPDQVYHFIVISMLKCLI